MFSTAWNKIIDCFRQNNIISNRERASLKFSKVEGSNQAVYLPVFQSADVSEDILKVLETPIDETWFMMEERESSFFVKLWRLDDLPFCL